MARYESYRAVADKKAARDVAATNKPFTIEVRFTGGLNKRQQDAFRAAARRWTRVIVGDLPRVKVDGEVIDDVLILAGGADIDGPGGILGQAGPSHIRPKRAGRSAFLPVKGEMRFDTADLRQMQKDGTLDDVIAHEMGHVLGVGTIWKLKGLLKNASSANPTFAGKGAIDEYRTLQGPGARRKQVPVENRGGSGTRGSHWREALFLNELMSGYVAAADNPLSRMTAASLGDLGYVVDRGAAEPYSLPNVRLLAEEGLLVSHDAPIDQGFMLPNIPLTLPDDSLQ